MRHAQRRPGQRGTGKPVRRRVSARRPRASGGDECDPHHAFAGQGGVGLCGGGTDGTLFLLTGLHVGGVGFTAELHDGRPVLDETGEEIVEVSFGGRTSGRTTSLRRMTGICRSSGLPRPDRHGCSSRPAVQPRPGTTSPLRPWADRWNGPAAECPVRTQSLADGSGCPPDRHVGGFGGGRLWRLSLPGRRVLPGSGGCRPRTVRVRVW